MFTEKDQHTTNYLLAYRQSGDLAVLGRLYEPEMGKVYAICYQYLKDKDEAKDAVMQIFEQLITDLRKHEVQNFQAWLHILARNHCLMALRNRKEIAGNDFFSEQFMESLPDVHLEDEDLEQDLTKLETCLETLNEAQLQTIKLFYWEQKSYTQIVESTGFELLKVKSYLQNGKRNLKNCIENQR